MGEVPTSEQVKERRAAANMTQVEAAASVYVHWRTWQQWEAGKSAMPAGLWELYRLKTSHLMAPA